jgi:HEPN domain-containing protein
MSDINDPMPWVERAEEDYLLARAVRYPGEDPTPEEAREAVEIAKDIRRFARVFLGIG